MKTQHLEKNKTGNSKQTLEDLKVARERLKEVQENAKRLREKLKNQ